MRVRTLDGVSTDVWWRNPDTYVRECIELHALNVLFEASFLRKRSIDPVKFLDLFVAPPLAYRCLVVDRNGTVELRRGDTMAKPSAVYPTWSYEDDDIQTLEELCEHPVGDSWQLCNDKRVPLTERPVYGQENRIIVTDVPTGTTGIAKRFLSTVRAMQDEYQDVILHPSGVGSFRLTFGKGFRSMDIDPEAAARRKELQLPNGKAIKVEQAPRYQQWFTLLGFKSSEMSDARSRVLYNMKAALWAGEHYNDDVPFRAQRGGAPVDPDAIDYTPATVARTSPGVGVAGDKILCNTCSLATTCKYFRAGEVCSLPRSETSSLAKMFNSRDPDDIIAGLGALMDVSSKRLEAAVENEEPDCELDPEVTKLINSIFGNGVKLAKLLAPQRFTVGSKVAINITGEQPGIAGPSQSELVAGFMKELEAQGIDVKSLSPEQLEALIGRFNAIEVPALEAG